MVRVTVKWNKQVRSAGAPPRMAATVSLMKSSSVVRLRMAALAVARAKLASSHVSPASRLRAAWARLCRRHHPDSGGDADAFAAVARAWDTLGDASSRAAYDAGLRLRGIL